MVAAREGLADPAGAAARLLLRLGLIVLMGVIPVGELFFYEPLYVLLPVGAGILILAGLLARADNARPRLIALLRSPIASAALFLFIWAALSLVWTPFLNEAAARFFKVSSTVVVVLFAILSLPVKVRADSLYVLPAALFITAVATILMTAMAPQIFWQGTNPDATLAQRSVMTLTILLWPAVGALALREKWLLAAGLAGAVVAAVLSTFIQVALVAVALASVVYAVAVSEAERVGQILGFGVAALVVLAPGAALATLTIANLAHVPASGPGFVFADLLIAQWPRFLTGHGFDFAVRAMEIGVLPPDTPHSILFKIWYELGVLGALGFSAMVATVFIAAGRAPGHIAPAILAGLVAGLVIAVWGVETTQIWWISLSGLDAIAFALIARGTAPAHRPSLPTGDVPLMGTRALRGGGS